MLQRIKEFYENTDPTEDFDEKTSNTEILKVNEDIPKEKQKKWFFMRNDIKWLHVLTHTLYNLLGIYGFLTYPYVERYKTLIWAFFLVYFGLFSVGAGLHRYWSHKSFQAKLPLKIIFASGFLTAFQFRFRKWVQFHRVHHKYVDTDADPHSSKHGLFYSHIGWLLVKRPKAVTDKFKNIDLSDIDSDPVIVFCDKYFAHLVFLAQIIAISVPVFCWNEELYYSILAQFMRFMCTFHCVVSVNSFAHKFGAKPFDKKYASTDNAYTAYLTMGEGWHNYHHVFPYDYRTSEFGGLRLDTIGKVIRFFEKIGWAYDLKQASNSLVKKTLQNRGDGTLLKKIDSTNVKDIKT